MIWALLAVALAGPCEPPSLPLGVGLAMSAPGGLLVPVDRYRYLLESEDYAWCLETIPPPPIPPRHEAQWFAGGVGVGVVVAVAALIAIR